MKSCPRRSHSRTKLLALSLGLAIAGPLEASAATTISYANPSPYSDTAISSTSGSSTLTVTDGTKWAIGDIIRFEGTSATTNPFGTSATRYYVTSVSGNVITVATTPGGTALNATNTTTLSNAKAGVDWFTTSNWTGGVVPNSNSVIANFGNSTLSSANIPVVVNGNATIYGLTFGGSANGDLLLASGANGTGLYSLTFATDDSSTPKVSLTAASNALIALGASGGGDAKLKVAGTQGLIFNSYQGGAITGVGTAATSTAPGKAIRSSNVDWSGLSGGVQVERGVFQIQAAPGVFTGQSLTVGNATTTSNNLLAGLNLQGFGSTVDALNGTSLGRIYGTSTLTVGSANGTGGDFAGVIGKDFAGATTTTNLAKSGTGTQTISGVMAGAGTVTVNSNGGTLILSSSNSYTGATTVNSGGTLKIGDANALGATGSSSATTVNSGGTLDFNGQTIGETVSVSGAGVSSAGALVNSNASTAATLTTDIVNPGSFSVGGAGDLTLQRVMSSGGVFTLTKEGTGTLTTSGSSHNNLMALVLNSGKVVFANTSGYGADRGVTINSGTLQLAGANSNLINDVQSFTMNGGVFDLNGKAEAVASISGSSGATIRNSLASSTATLFVGGGVGGTSSGTFAGVIENGAGTLNVTKEGTGTQTLTGISTYTGQTNVNNGTVLIDGAIDQGSGNNAGRIFVAAAGTIGGNGSIKLSDVNGATTGISISGTLAPGNGGVGTFTVDAANSARSAVSFESGSVLSFDITTGVADKFALVHGQASDVFFNNNVIKFSDLSGGTLSTNDVFTLFSSDVAGAYSGLTLSGNTITAGLTVDSAFLTSYPQASLKLSGNDIVLTIPEPSTALMLLSGMGSLALLRRARRS